MKTSILLFLLCLYGHLSAQPDIEKIIHEDTIRLRGKIYRSDGKPAKDIIISSRATDLIASEYRLLARTDTNGYFVLNGALFKDTITVFADGNNSLSFANNGSRFMVVYLPPQLIEINPFTPVEISAKRKYPKLLPKLSAKSSGILDGGCMISVTPRFPGGKEGFLNYIKHTLIYPEKAIKHNIEGTVEAGFIIEKDGSLIDIRILKGIGYGCDEELIALLKTSPHWAPGVSCGRIYPIRETVSVKFSLSDN